MKISYLLLIIGSIIAAAPYKFYDIALNEVYTVDITQFEEKYLPAHTNYFFRVPVEPEESYQVEIQVYKNSII